MRTIRFWRVLPGMFWHFPVTRAKPGATVLARHGDPRMRNEHGPHVLLATQLVGPGRTIFVGFDSTYRWRYLDESYFDGFWARMIDRAGRAKQLGGRYPYTLATDRSSYRPQSQVTLTAKFENATDRDAGLDQMHGEVEVPDEAPIPITLTPRTGDPNTFETTFPVTHLGIAFRARLDGRGGLKQVVRAATLQFPVELPNLEYDRPTLDQPDARRGGADNRAGRCLIWRMSTRSRRRSRCIGSRGCWRIGRRSGTRRCCLEACSWRCLRNGF